MLGLGWLTIRQAQEALENGRLEEAHRLLGQPEVSGHKGSSALLKQLAEALVKRGEEQAQHEDLTGAWNDLLMAERLGVGGTKAPKLRQQLVKIGLAEAHKLLEAGEPGRTIEVVGQLRQGSTTAADVQLVEEAAKGWNLAREMAARGEFALALETVDRVRPLLPKTPFALQRFRADVIQRRDAYNELIVPLHQAVKGQKWGEVVALAEKVLALAPQHHEARRARGRAWKAIEPAAKPGAVAVEEPASLPRFLLWVDGVGGYLVCLGSRVSLGQALHDATVDVPLVADVSRHHATITRDAEGYLLEAVRPVLVNGKPMDRALLQPGDRLILGQSCQVQFRQPVPVSASARLDLTSGHRLPLALDGVLLMADTLVLGPGGQSHVTVPDLQKPVVLYRHKDGLGIRCPGAFTVDGRPCKDRELLGENARVSGEEFALAVEPVSGKMGVV